MIVSTVILGTNKYGGKYNQNKIPQDRAAVSVDYQEEFVIPTWDGEKWIEGASQQEIDNNMLNELEKYTLKISEKIRDYSIKSIEKAFKTKGDLDDVTSYKNIILERLEFLKGKNNDKINSNIQEELDFIYPDENLLNEELESLGINPTGTKLKKYRELLEVKIDLQKKEYETYLARIDKFISLTNIYIKNKDFSSIENILNIDLLSELAKNKIKKNDKQ